MVVCPSSSSGAVRRGVQVLPSGKTKGLGVRNLYQGKQDFVRLYWHSAMCNILSC